MAKSLDTAGINDLLVFQKRLSRAYESGSISKEKFDEMLEHVGSLMVHLSEMSKKEKLGAI